MFSLTWIKIWLVEGVSAYSREFNLEFMYQPTDALNAGSSQNSFAFKRNISPPTAINRNRLLADRNLDLGLDRVGDQRRRIYYVVRCKEGIQLVGYLEKQQEAHSEIDGSLLVLNSLDFWPSVMHQCQDQLCLICHERKHKNNRPTISYIFAFCIHERDLNSGTLSLHSYTAPFVNTFSSN